MNFQQLSVRSLMALCVLSAPIVFSACNSDDEEEQVVAGIYVGTNEMSAMKVPMEPNKQQQVTLIPEADGEYTIKLSGFQSSFSTTLPNGKQYGATIGTKEWTITNVKAVKNGATVTLKSTALDNYDIAYNGKETHYKITQGTLEGKATNQELSLEVNFTPERMPASISYKINAKKK